MRARCWETEWRNFTVIVEHRSLIWRSWLRTIWWTWALKGLHTGTCSADPSAVSAVLGYMLVNVRLVLDGTLNDKMR